MARKSNRQLQQPRPKRFSPSLPFGIDSRRLLVVDHPGTAGGRKFRWRPGLLSATSLLLSVLWHLAQPRGHTALQRELVGLKSWLQRADSGQKADRLQQSLIDGRRRLQLNSADGCLMLSRAELLSLNGRLGQDLSSRQGTAGNSPSWQKRYQAQLTAAHWNLAQCQSNKSSQNHRAVDG